MVESGKNQVIYLRTEFGRDTSTRRAYIIMVGKQQTILDREQPQCGRDEKGRGQSHLLLRLFLLLVVLAILVAAGVWLNRPVTGQPTASSQLVFVPAKVTAVLEDNAAPDWEQGEGRRVGTQELEIQLLSGSHKGEVLPLTNYLSALFNVDVQEGDRVIVRLITQEDGSYYAAMFNYDRGFVMGGALLIFCAVLVILGGKKGLRALLGLVFTLLCLWHLLLPGLVRGLPAIPLTIGVVAVTAVASLVLLDGLTRKCLCASLGCVGVWGSNSSSGSCDGCGHVHRFSGVGATGAKSRSFGADSLLLRNEHWPGRHGNHGQYADFGLCWLLLQYVIADPGL